MHQHQCLETSGTQMTTRRLVNDFNSAPVSGLVGPTRGLVEELDADRLTGMLA
jgi:hypothetical protein